MALRRHQPCVYAVENDYGVKVGVTNDVINRRRELERSCGGPVRLLRSWDMPTRERAKLVEAWTHWRLREDRTVGEWFYTHPLTACAVVESVIRAGYVGFPVHGLESSVRLAA